MKRVFLLLLGLGLAALIWRVGRDAWQSARVFQDQGRAATIVIGKRRDTERWSSPAPIKKIYTYAAKMEPTYEVLVETDQELKTDEKRGIRFLNHDQAAALAAYPTSPVVNTLRLQGAEQEPVANAETTQRSNAFVEGLMGPLADEAPVQPQPRPRTEAAPAVPRKPTVPFVFAEKDVGVLGIIWGNSRIQEWILVGLGLLGVHSLLFAAYEHHKDSLLKRKRGKKFVHPSLRNIEPTKEEPTKKLTYVPKSKETIANPDIEKLRLAAKAAAASASTPAPASESAPGESRAASDRPAQEPLVGSSGDAPRPASRVLDVPAPLADRETAPPMPVDVSNTALKLPGKAPGAESGDGGDVKNPSAG